jgi:hypothetical protein
MVICINKLNEDELVKNIFEYNEDTGVLYWSVTRGRAAAGSEAGYTMSHHSGKEYRMVQVDGKCHYVHRIAYEIYHGIKPREIDHINGNGLDNRICNLRDVAKGDNQRNTRRRSDNKTGIAGVSVVRGRFKVMVSGRYLGMFEDFFEACCVRKSAQIRAGFHINHGK